MTGVFHHDASPRVLVVDDEPFVRRLIRAQLHQMDILEITEASNGQEALTHLDHHPVDLLVCDWNMPKISGLEVLDQGPPASKPR
jgi:CheY-like chemotaxis protein